MQKKGIKMNKTVMVQAHFISYDLNEESALNMEQPTSSFTGKIREFFIKQYVKNQINNSGTKSEKKKQRFSSDKDIDIVRLNLDINNEIEKLNNSGYEVISITPITSGEYKYDYSVLTSYKIGYGWGYGFSYTSGVIITAKKLNNKEV
jgi:hypothetical protein